MARVVVIATSEVGRGDLQDALGADDELVVLVPAVEQSRLEWLANDEDEARARAEEIGRGIAERDPAETSTIEVKPDDPQGARARRDRGARSGSHRPRASDDASWLEAGELAETPGERSTAFPARGSGSDEPGAHATRLRGYSSFRDGPYEAP